MIGLFFGGQSFLVQFGNQYGNIELDAVLDETHDWSADVTSNIVEDGAPVSDHIIEQPDKLRIVGFISDSPVSISQSITGFLNQSSVGNRTQAVFSLLHELVKLKEPMTVYTKFRVYQDMVLTNVNIPRTPANGEAIEFNAEFIHIRKVATQTVDVPIGINPKKTAKATDALGRKTEAAKNSGMKQAAVVPKLSSTLSRIFQ